jgi:hypothetical protein
MGGWGSQFWLGAGLIGGMLLSIFSESPLTCSGVLLSLLILIEYSRIGSPSFFGGGGFWDSFFSVIFLGGSFDYAQDKCACLRS